MKINGYYFIWRAKAFNVEYVLICIGNPIV